MRYNVVRKMKKLDKLQHKILNSTMGDYWILWEHKEVMLEKYLGRLLIENEISRMKKKKVIKKKRRENNVLCYKHMD